MPQPRTRIETGSFRAAAAVASLVLAASAPGCGSPATAREVARLARRVDSLAVTVTALNGAMTGRQAPAAAESLTVLARGAATLGRADAPVTIVEFTDYQCPFCARHAAATLPALRNEYVNRGVVRYVIRDLPLGEIHPFSRTAARAARCAGDQGAAKYWSYHDALFRAQPRFSNTTFGALARTLGLDRPRFAACLASDRFAAAVDSDAAAARVLGFNGTPGFVIGRTAPGPRVTGVVIRGAYPVARFETAIEGALAAPAIHRH